MTVNYVQLLFSFFTTIIIVTGSLINTFETYLPVFISQIFRYGKFAYNGNEKISKLVIPIPKSSFRQFYKFAVIIFTFIFIIATKVYVYGENAPTWLRFIVDLMCGKDRVAYVNGTKAYIAIVLMTLQVYRRCYDTHFVSIFSKNGKINFAQYFIGMIYYPLVALAILCESPKFATFAGNNSGYNNQNFNLAQLSWPDIIGILLFLWAWYHQHITTKILADLRRDKKGEQISDEHGLPEGDWFKYLSCPHQTAEMLMYFALSIILLNNVTWGFVVIWVVACQVESILLSHWWYLEKFPDFPKSRKALIPFVY